MKKNTMNHGLAEAVSSYMARHALLRGVRRLGLAISGGADSVALLHVLLPLCRQSGITPHVLHLNHGLRGKASDADQNFVKTLAARNGLPCTVGRAALADARAMDGTGKLSLEMRSRAARLAFFHRSVRDLCLDAIATAHHADDVAENLLLRLARGAGMTGLSGLRPRSVLRAPDAPPLTIIRPLLGSTRAELRAWLRGQRHAWREDASNRDISIPRNHVRRIVLPWLEKNWQPALRRQLSRSADILRAEDEYLDAMAETALTDIVGPRGALRRTKLLRLPLALQRRAVRLWLGHQGVAGDAAGFAAVAGILDRLDKGASPKPAALQARKKSSHRQHHAVPVQAMPLAIPGAVSLAGSVRITARLARGITRKQGSVGSLPAACSLDPSVLAGPPLVVRYRRPGDRISPLGMNGSRKIQDILVDAKVPAETRDRIPLLVQGDEVIWLPGYRVARAHAVRNPAASNVQVRFAGMRRPAT